MPRPKNHPVVRHTVQVAVLTLTMLPPSPVTADTYTGDRETVGGKESSPADLQTATFGAGCFWCTEAVYQRLDGVISAVSGYSGGRLEAPTYKQVLTGLTGHAEVVQVTFDPEVISYKDLLEVFWKTHDPTTRNRQGPDVGTQYRSVIFYHTDEQKQLATYFRRRVDESTMFRRPVVTEISPFEAFYPAEAYHQDYYAKNGQQSYCRRYIRPKIAKVEETFEDKLKEEPSPLKKIRKPNSEWGKQLSRAQYQVTRRNATDPPFSGRYWNHKEDGTYKCVCCDLPLFDSATKFDSGTGWPSFWAPVERRHIDGQIDRSHHTVRMEVTCARCDAHLGHVFKDGPAPTGLRYCINSASLQFEKAKEE